MEMNGNSILITGGATGIGLSMAKYLYERGNTVLICDKREDRLSQTARELPKIQTIKCDVTSPNDRSALFAYVKEFFSDMNILINNAGIQRDIDLTKGMIDFESGESELRVNLEAPILLSALFTPMLSEKKNATIVNVSSRLAFMPDFAAEMPIYHATKAGLHAFSLVQRKQLSSVGIRVIELIPPAVQSELNPARRKNRDADQVPKMMPPDEFVKKVFAEIEQNIDEIMLEERLLTEIDIS